MHKVFLVFIVLVVFVGAGFYLYKTFDDNKMEVVDLGPSVAVLKLAHTDLALSEDGLVIAATGSNLPVLFLEQNKKVKIGQKINDQVVKFTIDLAKSLAKTDYTPVNVRILSSFEIAVYNSNGTIAIFSSQKPQEIQINSLQALLSQAKIDANKIAKVDLRFDKPIVTNKK